MVKNNLHFKTAVLTAVLKFDFSESIGPVKISHLE